MPRLPKMVAMSKRADAQPSPDKAIITVSGLIRRASDHAYVISPKPTIVSVIMAILRIIVFVKVSSQHACDSYMPLHKQLPDEKTLVDTTLPSKCSIAALMLQWLHTIPLPSIVSRWAGR